MYSDLIVKALVLITLMLPATAATLDSDANLPFKIKADAAVVNESTGVTVYSGKVTIDQGTLHIAADEVRVLMNQREVLQIIARMEPDSKQLAHYEQQPDLGNMIYADARTITYFLREEQLHLTGQARLKQTNDLFEGELLYYDLAKRIVELKGDGKQRVAITLEPKDR